MPSLLWISVTSTFTYRNPEFPDESILLPKDQEHKRHRLFEFIIQRELPNPTGNSSRSVS